MATIFLNSVDEATKKHPKISVDNQLDPPTKIHNGKKYTFYGEVTTNRNSCWKIGKIFQIIFLSIPLLITLGLIWPVKRFQSFFVNKLVKLLEPEWTKKTTNIFLEKFPQKPGNKDDIFKFSGTNFTTESSAFYAQRAEYYLNQGNQDQAFEMIKHIIDNTRKTWFTKLADAYFKAGDLKKVFEVTNNHLFDSDAFLVKIVEDYLNKGDLENAFLVTENMSDTSNKNAFFAKLVDVYIKAGDRQKADEVINKIGHRGIQDAKLAEVFLEFKEPKKAQEILKGSLLMSDDSYKAIFVKLVEGYLNDGDRESAFVALRENLLNDELITDALYIKLADAYSNADDPKKALPIIKCHIRDKATKDALLAKFPFGKLIEVYLKERNYKSAFDIIDDINDDTTKEALLVKIAIDKNIGKEKIDDALYDILLIEFKANRSNIDWVPQIDEALLDQCYSQSETYLKEDNAEMVLKTIKDFAKTHLESIK